MQVRALVPGQEDREERLRGPPTKAAFDKEGNPTKAAEGFCKKNGVSMSDVVREKDEKGVEYLFATVQQKVRTYTSQYQSFVIDFKCPVQTVPKSP